MTTRKAAGGASRAGGIADIDGVPAEASRAACGTIGLVAWFGLAASRSPALAARWGVTWPSTAAARAAEKGDAAR